MDKKVLRVRELNYYNIVVEDAAGRRTVMCAAPTITEAVQVFPEALMVTQRGTIIIAEKG